MRRISARSAAVQLAAIGRRFHVRGWALGTSGNYSAVTGTNPLRLAITASGLEKRTLHARDVVQVDVHGKSTGRSRGVPSAETVLHLEIVRRCGAGAVLHTHSVWGTMLSDLHAPRGAVDIHGYEMLKGLGDVTTHDHHERVPIVENDQDMPRLAKAIGGMLEREPRLHAFLLRRHGLYTWGGSLGEAERHVEILEFLFETVCRTMTIMTTGREAPHGDAQDS